MTIEKLLRIAREGNESIPVRHPHLGQRLRVEHVVGPDDPIEIENIGRYRVEFIAGERLRLFERHRAPNIVEQSRRVRPAATYSLDRRLARRERTGAADKRIVRAPGTILAVAGLTIGG